MQKLLLSLCLAACAGSLRAENFFAIESGNFLVAFDTELSFIATRYITGLRPGERILGIDFRPANKQLYGLGSTSRLYVIDPETAVARVVGDGRPFAPTLDGTAFGFDFNPTVDRIRVVSNVGQNLRLHPDTGAVVAQDRDLNYADGVTPLVAGSAYTNSVAGASSTVLYNLDVRRRALVIQNPPNDGRLVLDRDLRRLEFSELAGFDISPNTNQAFVMGRLANRNRSVLVPLDLSSGTLGTMIELPVFEQISGLAIQPNR
jgi:hypothetical protein